MALFTPAWKGKNEEKAIKKINSITDQMLLYKIATDKTVSPDRAIAACRRIHDENVLYQIATFKTINCIPIELRLEACRQITKEKTLYQIVVFSLNDETTLSQLLIDALNRISDEELLYKLATYYIQYRREKYRNVSKLAYDRLSDEYRARFLAEKVLLYDSSDKKEKKDAVNTIETITDANALKIIAEKSKDESIRNKAIKQINDATILWDLFCNSNTSDYYVLCHMADVTDLSEADNRDLLLAMIDAFSTASVYNPDKPSGTGLSNPTVKKAVERLKLLGMLNDDAVRDAKKQDSKRLLQFAVAENDLLSDLDKIKGGAVIREAYVNEDVITLRQNPSPQSVRALVLLLWKTEERSKQIEILEILKALYYQKNELKNQINNSVNGYETASYSQGMFSCLSHEDIPSEIYYFE